MTYFNTDRFNYLVKTPHDCDVIRPDVVDYDRSVRRAFVKPGITKEEAISRSLKSFGRAISVNYVENYRSFGGSPEFTLVSPELLVADDDIAMIASADLVIVSSRCAEAIIYGFWQRSFPSLRLPLNLLDRFYTPSCPVIQGNGYGKGERIGVTGFKRVLPLASPAEYVFMLQTVVNHPTVPISAASALMAVDVAMRQDPWACMYDGNVQQLVAYLAARGVWVDSAETCPSSA